MTGADLCAPAATPGVEVKGSARRGPNVRPRRSPRSTWRGRMSSWPTREVQVDVTVWHDPRCSMPRGAERFERPA